MYVYTLKVTITADDFKSHADAALAIEDAVREANRRFQNSHFPMRLSVEDINVTKKRDQ